MKISLTAFSKCSATECLSKTEDSDFLVSYFVYVFVKVLERTSDVAFKMKST